MAFERPNTYGAGTGVTYDPEVLQVVWERLAEDAKVVVLLLTRAPGADLPQGRLAATRTWTPPIRSSSHTRRSKAAAGSASTTDSCATKRPASNARCWWRRAPPSACARAGASSATTASPATTFSAPAASRTRSHSAAP